ncbi:MAG TPA: hypothetical protein VMR41_03275 [Patescibacteria group bacterium]|nr:hypothetical protein [Patescibacteria group bacterium]
MVSFVIFSKDKQLALDYIKNECAKQRIAEFDQIVLNKDSSEKIAAQSIGIDSIKMLQKKIYLKPMQSEDKAVIVQDGQMLTTEAQNAMLKILEEPPLHTFIYILVSHPSELLPTILSRCKIVILEQSDIINEKEVEQMNSLIQSLAKMTNGEKLKLAETMAKQKPSAILWLEALLQALRSNIYTAGEQNDKKTLKQYLQFAKQIQLTLRAIQTTNVNLRLTLENLLLSL